MRFPPIRPESQDNNLGNNFGSEVNVVDAVAKWREKRSVRACMIPGTGPCTVNGECCSDFCVNHVCCLHKNTCDMSRYGGKHGNMEDSLEKSDPGRPGHDPVVSLVPKLDSSLQLSWHKKNSLHYKLIQCILLHVRFK